MPESEMIEGCLRNDRKSQEKMYKTFASRMMGVCMRYSKNRETAEDILQEGFIKAFRALASFRKEGSFEGWLRKIMVRTALEHFRKEVRFFPLSQIDAAKHTAGEEEILSRMNTKEVMEKIMDLPPGYRTVLNLYVIEGYNHAEIGEMLGISEGTSKSQLSRARDVLKQTLKHYSERKVENA